MPKTHEIACSFYCEKLGGPIDVSAIYDVTMYEGGLYSKALRPIKPGCDCCPPGKCPLVEMMKEYLRWNHK